MILLYDCSQCDQAPVEEINPVIDLLKSLWDKQLLTLSEKRANNLAAPSKLVTTAMV